MFIQCINYQPVSFPLVTNKIMVQHFQLTALAQLPLLLDVDYMNTASFNCEIKNCQLLICYTLPYHWEEYNLHTQVTQSSVKDESEASVQCFCQIDATVIVMCGCIVCFVTWWWVLTESVTFSTVTAGVGLVTKTEFSWDACTHTDKQNGYGCCAPSMDLCYRSIALRYR